MGCWFLLSDINSKLKDSQIFLVIIISSVLLTLGLSLYKIYGPSPLDRFKVYLKESDKIAILANLVQSSSDKSPHNKYLTLSDLTPEIQEAVSEIDLDAHFRYLTLEVSDGCQKKTLSLMFDNWTFEYHPCANYEIIEGEKSKKNNSIDVYYFDKHWMAWVDNDPL